MNNNYNAALQGGSTAVSRSSFESGAGMSNPIQSGRTMPAQSDGLIDKNYCDAIRSMALAQINIGNKLRYC